MGIEQKVFEYIKRIVARGTLLVYPDFNERFDIHTYASDYQLGAVTSQDDKTIALYRWKPTGPQNQYTGTEKSLLSIVETLKQFRTILPQKLHL